MTDDATQLLDADAPIAPPARPNRVAAWWRGFARPPRIMGVDVARALAIIGMIGAHVGSTPELVWSDPTTWAGIVHGRSSVLFAVLAGISVSIVTGRTRPLPREEIPAARLRLVGRGGAVLLIGILLELLNTNIAVILGVYGLLFIIATAFLHWSAKRLFAVGTIVALAGPPVMALLHALSLDAWGPTLDFLVFGTYPVTVWIAYLLIGMGVGRLRIETRTVATGVLCAGVVLAFAGYGTAALVGTDGDSSDSYPSGSPSYEDYFQKPGSEVNLDGMTCDVSPGQWVSCYPEEEGFTSDESVSWSEDVKWTGSDIDGWELQHDSYLDRLLWDDIWNSMRYSMTSAIPHSGAVLDIVGSTGFALAVIGTCILLSRPLRWLLLPLAALGSMPLTAYAVHVLSVVVMAGGPGGFVDNSNGVWIWSILALTAAALLWSIAVGKGPLEKLVGRAGAAMARPPKAANAE